MSTVLPWLSIAIIGIVLSALFSGIEIGVYTLNRIGLAVRVGRGERRARILDAELARPDRMLTTLLIGNNIAHYVSSLGIAAVLATFDLGPIALVVINTALLLPIMFVLAETLPKDLFRAYTDRWSYVFAGYLRLWRVLLTWTLLVPLVAWIGAIVKRWVGCDEQGALVEPRLRMSKLIREGVHAGVLSEEQTTFADRALTLRGRTVEGEMTPWSRVTSVALEASLSDRSAVLRRSGASRLPVTDGAGRVVGVLTALDAILTPAAGTRELMSRPTFVPRTETALSALRVLRSTRTRLAIVVDPTNGSPLGVVAFKDLIEPVTGQLVGS
ncbi:MAG: CNNM domain-containing protein [Phycisphaerae bacterium]|nr:CNNM domain-containing protein [Phycisphaerae bacterium]